MERKNCKEAHIMIDGRDRNATRFFTDIDRYKPMTVEEEVEAFTRLAAGDESVKDEIVKRNIRFVISRAKLFTGDGRRFNDAVQEGCIGLMAAADKFDVTMGMKFISFAVHYIDCYIRKFVESGTVRQTNDKKIGARLARIRSDFFAENGREPVEWEIEDILDEKYGVKVCDRRDVAKLTVTSMDRCIGDNDDVPLSECGEIADATASVNGFVETCEKEDTAYRCRILMQALNENERKVVEMTFGIGCRAMTDEEIASELKHKGIPYTRERIRQIRVNAMGKMKRMAKVAV